VITHRPIAQRETVFVPITKLISEQEAMKLQQEDYTKCLNSDPPWYTMPNWFLKSGEALRMVFRPEINLASKLNHSTEPNMIVEHIVTDNRPHVSITTTRNVAAGEELTIDYDCSDAKLVKRFPWLREKSNSNPNPQSGNKKRKKP
jgi:SET domain-containing protein